jgi:hypothetical protein
MTGVKPLDGLLLLGGLLLAAKPKPSGLPSPDATTWPRAFRNI